MSIVIRQASADDVPRVLALYAELDRPGTPLLSEAQAQATFAQFARYPNYRLFVALDGSTMVGTYALLIMHNLAHRGMPSAVVEDVVVQSTRRGQGIGRRMMAHAREQAREAGCYKLALSSNLRRSDAHAFYTSLGFQQHGLSFLIEP